MKIEKILICQPIECVKAVFSHFWLMEQIFFQNRQNMRDISEKLSVNSKVFLGTLPLHPIVFSTYAPIIPGMIKYYCQDGIPKSPGWSSTI